MAHIARSRLLRCPQQFLFKGKNPFAVDKFDMSRFEEAHKHVEHAVHKEGSISAKHAEAEYLRSVYEKSDVLSFTDEKTNDLVTTIALWPSPTCRSTYPMVGVALTAINPKYKDRGIAIEAFKYCIYHAVDLGFLGATGRISVAASNLVAQKKGMGCELVGIIPFCKYKDGHIDDIIHYLDYHVDERFPEQYQVCGYIRKFHPYSNNDHKYYCSFPIV